MFSSVQWELRRPEDDKLFEQLVRDLFAAHWNDDSTAINGRPGQEQRGVDVYGQPNQAGKFFGIQCKLRSGGTLSRKQLVDEIELARSFRIRLDTYIFATTLPRDVKLQAVIHELNQIEVNQGGFRIQIRFWEDLCALLDEHPRIIEKFYGQSGLPKKLKYETSKEHSDQITSTSPLLMGILIDLSRSALNRLSQLSQSSGISRKRLSDAINLLVEKAVAFCKTPESKDLLPRFALFLYGYGFGKGRQAIVKAIKRIGIQTGLSPELIPSEPIRDLFAEIAAKESLPFTPTASELNMMWGSYQESVEAQIFDTGLGESLLYDALVAIKERLQKEFERPYYKYPMILVISDGSLDGATDEDVARISTEIHQLGAQIVSCYLGKEIITNYRTLYEAAPKAWPQDAKRLFRMSSNLSEANHITKSIVSVAEENAWTVPPGAKLFVQVNHSGMIEELVEMLTRPLKIQ